MIIKQIASLYFIFLTTTIFAQDTSKSKSFSYQTGVTVSYIHQDIKFISIGGIIRKKNNFNITSFSATGLCFDIALNSPKDLIYAPRIFFEGSTKYFGLRLSIAEYFKNTETDLRINPDFFLSFKGLVNLSFGYSFSTSQTPFNEISNYKLAVTYNLVK